MKKGKNVRRAGKNLKTENGEDIFVTNKYGGIAHNKHGEAIIWEDCYIRLLTIEELED
jgi:hypothetical protein